MEEQSKARAYTAYPMSSVLLYEGLTVAHFAVGALGVYLAVGQGTWGWIAGGVYAAFAFGQMWIIMPLAVCPHCVYRRMEGARCVSGLNLLSAKMTAPRDLEGFEAARAEGILCHNNLYMGALIAPAAIMLPALFFSFSAWLLAAFFAVVGMMAFRIFYVFPKVACGNCAAKARCPNARQMGIA